MPATDDKNDNEPTTSATNANKKASSSLSTLSETERKRRHKSSCLCFSCACKRKKVTRDEEDKIRGESERQKNKETNEKDDDECIELNEMTLTSENALAFYRNKRHYKSMKSTFLRESDLKPLKNKYAHGIIKIQEPSGIVCNADGNYYLKFKFDAVSNAPGGSIDQSSQKASSKPSQQLRNIPKFMSSVWAMKSPQIIIPIITGITNFKNWKNQKLEEQFRHGIIKAANKTEMWFITHGINGGISEMVGEAFGIERVSRETTSLNDAKMSSHGLVNYSESREHHFKPLTLIGIIPTSFLQNSGAFDGHVIIYYI